MLRLKTLKDGIFELKDKQICYMSIHAQNVTMCLSSNIRLSQNHEKNVLIVRKIP